MKQKLWENFAKSKFKKKNQESKNEKNRRKWKKIKDELKIQKEEKGVNQMMKIQT